MAKVKIGIFGKFLHYTFTLISCNREKIFFINLMKYSKAQGPKYDLLYFKQVLNLTRILSVEDLLQTQCYRWLIMLWINFCLIALPRSSIANSNKRPEIGHLSIRAYLYEVG